MPQYHVISSERIEDSSIVMWSVIFGTGRQHRDVAGCIIIFSGSRWKGRRRPGSRAERSCFVMAPRQAILFEPVRFLLMSLHAYWDEDTWTHSMALERSREHSWPLNRRPRGHQISLASADLFTHSLAHCYFLNRSFQIIIGRKLIMRWDLRIGRRCLF